MWKVLAVGGAVLLPAVGRLVGVLFGTRQMKRQARFALELAEDPVAARAARARERRVARWGWSLGILTGTAGLIAGLWMS